METDNNDEHKEAEEEKRASDTTQEEEKRMEEEKKMEEENTKKRKECEERLEKLLSKMKSSSDDQPSTEAAFNELKDIIGGPDTDWIKTADNTAKQKYLENITKDLGYSRDLISKEDMPPLGVVEKSNALRGVYCTSDLMDWILLRSSILDCPAEVAFREPLMAQKDEVEEFESNEQHDAFHQAVQTSGFGVAAEVTASSSFGIGGHVGGSHDEKKEDDEKTQTNTSGTFYSKLVSHIVPTALWRPNIAKMKICENVLDGLTNIQRLLTLQQYDDAYKSCVNHFQQFGSHFYRGDIHFGGVYTIDTTYKSNSVSKKESVKSLVQSKQSAEVGISYSSPVASVESTVTTHHESGDASNEGTYEECNSSNATTQRIKKGGPLEVSDVNIWQQGLVANRSTWRVIDRGSLALDTYIGIWELILMQSYDFTSAVELARFLYDTWQKITGLNGGDTLLNQTEKFTADDKLRHMISSIKTQLSSDKDSETYLRCLTDLCEEIQSVDKGIWLNQLLTNSYVADFLLDASSIHSPEIHELEIRRMIGELLESTDTVDFHRKAEIRAQLIYEGRFHESIFATSQISSIQEFLAFTEREFFNQLTRTINDRKENQNDITSRYINIDFAVAVVKLLNSLQDQRDGLQYLVFIGMVLQLRYDVANKQFSKKMTISDLESFVKDGKEKIKDYLQYTSKVGQQTRREAWVIRLLIEKLKDTAELTEIKKTHHQLYITEKLAEVIICFQRLNFKFTKKVCDLLGPEPSNIEIYCLSKSLNDIIENNESSNSICWDHFEWLPDSFYDNLKHKVEGNAHVPSTDDRFPEEIKYLIQEFHLSKYFPGKLSLPSVLAVHDDLYKKPKCLKDLPWAILRKIISIDYTFREKLMHDFVQDISIEPDDSQGNTNEDDDLVKMLTGMASTSENKKNGQIQPEKLHPSDVILAILYCCDPFLKKNLIQKICACQFAIPLLYKNCLTEDLIFSIWPIGETFVDVEGFSTKSVVQQSFKSVSFLRIGDKRLRSKSKLINGFLRNENEEHSTFFHSDCVFGMNDRMLSTGTIEMSWYVPTFETSEAYSSRAVREPLALFNLRGDAFLYKKQMQLLLHMSSMFVLVARFKDLSDKKYAQLLREVHNSKSPIVLVTDLPNNPKQLGSELQHYVQNTCVDVSKTRFLSINKAGYGKLNMSETKQELTKHICYFLEKLTSVSLESVAHNLPIGIKSDEIEGRCLLGKKLSDEVFSQALLSTDLRSTKDLMLPLQGEDLWQKWSDTLKKQRRSGTRDSYDATENLPNTMKQIRRSQIEKCNSALQNVANFVEHFLSHINDEEVCLYFLSWSKRLFDNKSRVVLPALRKHFYDTFKNYEKSRSQMAQIEMKKSEQTLVKASLGIEHVLREIGQIYEAFMYCKDENKCNIQLKTTSILNYLPVIAAKMLLMGHALEIMDGDAANVPLRWVKAVFGELKNLLGDKELFSISVIGIQSSGKSTLLNTMFGLQFAVSAGRCTKGMYVQLISVDHSRSSLDFDYVMVIDTEGLRAPELADESINHDNELATLVFGLADLTLINIKGETIADMENVLEIVVSGLLRLKQANHHLELHQSCMMVHQNVPAYDASKLAIHGSQKTLEKLDAMTLEIASHEQMTEISQFKQVIEFDPLLNIKYISDLWHGHPPMAPVSPDYSKKTVDVAQYILDHIATKKNQFLSITDTCLQLDSLWNGILAEDFVFSFRNCLEVKAYGLLEAKYQILRWKLQEEKLNWWNENVKQQFSSSKNVTDCANSLIADGTLKIKHILKDAEQELVDFIEKAKLKNEMMNYKESKIRNLQSIASDLQYDIANQVHEEEGKSIVVQKTRNLVEEKEAEINKNADLLARKWLGKNPSSEEMHGVFDEMWIKWFNEIAPETPVETVRMKQTIVKKEMRMALMNEFSDHTALITDSVQEEATLKECQFLKGSFGEQITDNDINVKSRARKVRNWFYNPDAQKFARQLVSSLDEMFEEIDTYFETLSRQDNVCDKTHFSKILNILKSGLEDHNTDRDKKFVLTPVLQTRVALHVYYFSVNKFIKFNQIYDDKHSVRAQLRSYKANAWKVFQLTVEGKTKDTIAANFLCMTLKCLLREKVQRYVSLEMQRKMNKEFNHDKYCLMKTILEDLAKGKMFSQYISYIKKPETFAFEWITKFTNRTIFERQNSSESSTYVQLTGERIQSLNRDIKAAVNFVTSSVRPDNITGWITHFCTQVKENHLMITNSSFKHLEDQGVVNYEDFQKSVITQLNEIEKSLLDEFKAHSPDRIQWDVPTPYEHIFEFLWGCKAKCPLCYEPCRLNDSRHMSSDKKCHECILHRSSGIAGTHCSESKELRVEGCNFDVYSSVSLKCGAWCGCTKSECSGKHPYKKYRDYMPDWYIAPANEIPTYWKWFMANFMEDLAAYYGREKPKMPDSWKEISETDAIDSLADFLHV